MNETSESDVGTRRALSETSERNVGTTRALSETNIIGYVIVVQTLPASGQGTPCPYIVYASLYIIMVH